MTLRTLILSGILIACLSACHKSEQDLPQPDPDPTPTVADAYTQRVTSFVYQVMKQVYFWNKQIPEIDRKYETDAKRYFEKLLVKEDRFSNITDDLPGLLKSMDGIEKSYGYSLGYSWLDETETKIVAIVEYVYPNTPADKAGIRRGDLIVLLDGQDITTDNMYDLMDNPSITISYMRGSENKTIKLAAVEIEKNPVHTIKVIDVKGKKTGYLFYSSYIERYNPDLHKVFLDFKAAGVSELILDLRYNLGGDDQAMAYLSSLLVPTSVATSKDVLIFNEYNEEFKKEFQKEGVDPTDYFTDTLLDANLDLKRIFVLTSDQTYSASEATILGLQPYMEVVCIGETTGGKDTGIGIFAPFLVSNGEEYLDPVIYNWGILPIICQYKNKNGASAKGGIVPQFEVKSFYLPMVELGDEKDPLVAKAIEILGGQPALAFSTKAAPNPIVAPFAHQTSPFDEIKKNLIKK